MHESENTVTNSKFKEGVNRNARLIVRNISFKATEDSLREHFSQYGDVEEVKLLKKPDGRLVGCGFVHFTHVPVANKAIAATNKKPFLGRPIYVAWAVAKDKYVANSNHIGQKQRNISISSNEDKSEKKDEDNKDTNKKEDKNKVRINRNARLIVRNISFKATEESLKEHFDPYGIVQEVKVLKKPDGKLIGCAFVHFKNVPMAKKALLNTNMKPFLGRPISVDWAVPKDKYMQHVVNSQMEMEEKVKKEDSDSDDDDKTPINISTEEVKDEVKSESECSDEASDENEEKSSDDEPSEEDESDDEDEEEGSDNEVEDDDKSVTSTQTDRQRIKLNDAEDGCTVFMTNVPFSVDDDQLRTFAEQTGPVKYALNKDDTDRFLSLPPEQLRLEGQVLVVKPALKRENV
ncbi:unnamed protein product [Leptidea sinapis]|nr:unnamed protein product [Leptidea sinapis]